MSRRGARVPISNRLLDQLGAPDQARMLGAGERVELSFAEVLAEPGSVMTHAYFPLGSSISLVTPMGGKSHLEVALTGNEGFYGIDLAMGVEISSVHALVQGSGPAIRLAATSFRRQLASVPALRRCVDRYIYVVMSQLIQGAGCNRFHVIEQRLARWLLMTADRSHSASFHVTHEMLASMLGVRRVGITKAASGLQDRQLISYARGAVTILDRTGLEQASCGCYSSDLRTYARVFG